MSSHLTEDQFAKCAAGQPDLQEQRHLAGCGECSSELNRFRTSISKFRGVLTDRVERRIALHPALKNGPVTASDPWWRWGVVAATALVLAIVPFAGFQKQIVMPRAIERTQSEADADALMRRVELQLSQTIPTPMEPVLALLPTNERQRASGGAQ